MSAVLKTGADARAMLRTKFPPEFNQKVDMKKVNVSVIKKWVADEVARILKSDDDVVPEMIFTILDESRFPNIKELQTTIAGFLDKDVSQFCLSLWKLCLSAQANPNGIPQELLDAKKHELIKERVEEERAREAATKRYEDELARERDLTRVRESERDIRERERAGSKRFSRGYDRRQHIPNLRSPPRRKEHESDEYRRVSIRGSDSYTPRDQNQRITDKGIRYRRSPSYDRSRSRRRSLSPRYRRDSPDVSRSPPARRRQPTNPGPTNGRATRARPRHEGRQNRRSPSPRRRRESFSSSDDGYHKSTRHKRKAPSSPSLSPENRRRHRRRSISRSSSYSRSPASPPLPRQKKDGSLPEGDLIGARPADSRRLESASLSHRVSDSSVSRNSSSVSPPSPQNAGRS